jgi:hypothetical protein
MAVWSDDQTGAPFASGETIAARVVAWSAVVGAATFLAGTVSEFWSGWVAGTLPAH